MADPIKRSWSDFVLGALRTYLKAQASLSGIDVVIGWKGNRSLARPTILLEAGTADREDRPAALKARSFLSEEPESAWSVDEETGVATAVADVGMQSFPIHVEVSVKDSTHGKTVRSEILSDLEDLFFRGFGSPMQIELTLGNATGMPARILIEDEPIAADEPEGVTRDIWVARWTWQARHGLEREVEVVLNESITVKPEIDGVAEADLVVTADS